MNPRAIAITIAFTALTIVLNPVRIPTLYWPGFFYRLWEIPIIVAFLLFGSRIGVSVAVLNVLAQIMLFPIPAGILAYPWGLVATLTMLLGVYLAYKFFTRRPPNDRPLFGAKPILYFTSLGIAFRAGIMPFVDYAMYRSLLPLALGQSFTEA
jgi:riboflavin transporter FmnP